MKMVGRAREGDVNVDVVVVFVNAYVHGCAYAVLVAPRLVASRPAAAASVVLLAVVSLFVVVDVGDMTGPV